MVKDIMGDAQAIAHRARVADITARTARARAAHRLAMVVELQGDADRLGPVAWASAATTELSTPPDIATTIRLARGAPS